MTHILGDYYVDADGLCYTAKIDRHRKGIKKVGEENVEYDVFDTIGYYSTMNAALNGIFQYECRNQVNNNNNELKDLVEYMDNMFAEIKVIAERI